MIQKQLGTLRLWSCFRFKPISMAFSWIWSWLRKLWISRAVTKTVKFKERELSKNKIVNYFETSLDLEYTSPALKKHEICLNFRKTSEWKFRIVIQNADIFSSLLMTKHAEIKILPPLYWIPSTVLMLSPTVLMLSPACTDVIPPIYWISSTVQKLSPHCTDVIPHCTEQPPQYLRYPPQYWSYPSTCTDVIHPQYWCYPRMYLC